LVQFEIKAEFDTSGCEFFVTLGRSTTAPSSDRLSIVQRYLDEAPRSLRPPSHCPSESSPNN
jgi:hypothetical protein